MLTSSIQLAGCDSLRAWRAARLSRINAPLNTVSACLRCWGSLNQDFGLHALGIVFHFNAAGVEEHFGACDTRDGGEGFFNFLDARRAAQFITA